MSNIDSLELPAVPAAPDYKTVDLHSVFLPTHDLYSEMKGTMQWHIWYWYYNIISWSLTLSSCWIAPVIAGNPNTNGLDKLKAENTSKGSAGLVP